MVRADKLFSDFNVAFEYKSSDDKCVRDTADNVSVGMVIQRLGQLDDLETSNPITDPKYYQAKYVSTDSTSVLKSVASNGTTNNSGGFITLRQVIDKSKLSNKNRIEYYYTFNNNKVVFFPTNANGEAFEATTDKNYVYRAYSYINVNGTVTLSSTPAYFTLYDIATAK